MDSKTFIECLSFLISTQQHVGQAKAYCQNFRREIPGFERPYKPVVKLNSNEVRNELETLQNLCFYQEKSNGMLDLLQRFELLHVLDVAMLEKNLRSILTFFGRI